MTQKPDNPPAMMTNEQMAAAVARVKELDAKRHKAHRPEDLLETHLDAQFDFFNEAPQMAELITQLWDENELKGKYVDTIQQQRAVMVQVRDELKLCRPEHVTRGLIQLLNDALGGE